MIGPGLSILTANAKISNIGDNIIIASNDKITSNNLLKKLLYTKHLRSFILLKIGANDGNRTHNNGLGSRSFTTKLHSHKKLHNYNYIIII